MNAKDKAIKSKMGTYIIIIRHGETDLNKEGRIRGWSDVPLSKDAKPTIEKTGKELKGKVDVLVSSDLERTVETANIISKITGAPIVLKTGVFRPWDVGKHTGEPQNEVYKFMDAAARNEPSVRIEGGESFNEFKDRFLEGVCALKEDFPGKKIGLVTHHRGDRIFAAWNKAGQPKSYKVDLDVFLSPGGVDPGEACHPVEI